jgi:cell division protease FtsH
MLVPVKWMKKYVDIDVDDKTLADKLTLTGSHVDAVIDYNKEVKGVVTGRILEINQHPNADKLVVTKIDTNQGEPLQIITGAKNVKKDDVVPVALEGAELPNGLKIKKSNFRGLPSYGMMVSYEELGFEDKVIPKESRDGIIILPPDTPLGADIKEVLDLTGSALEVEVTFNRPDCLNIVGMARETAATLGTRFKFPKIEIKNEEGNIKDYLKGVEIEDEDLCSRFYARVIKDLKIGPSPLWMQRILMDIIDFLNNEDKYRLMDAKVPRGILLYGPPGTGKTLIAKAIAGEAKATFIYASGSEFVEKYVGVGAKRVRTIFERARKEAPSIIFIDEIDALGAKRNADSNNEKDQTLNQLLIELDGFNNTGNVIVIAATNRLDLLDEALLRPGRFDRKIYVGNPNFHSRLKILEVHTKNKPLDKKVQLKDIAVKTHGFSGAQLANIANEAALKAIKDKSKKITIENFEFAIEKIAAGLEVKHSTVSDKEKRIVAYHEAGHAVAAKMLNIDKVQKISIIPRDKALGYVLKFPTEDKFLYTKNELFDKVVVLLAGRASEEIFIGEISTGASNDIKESTNIIYEIICSYGMGKNTQNTCIDERLIKYYLDNIKDEAQQMTADSYDRALSIIRQNEAVVDKVARYLLKYETMNAEKLDELMEESQKRALI